MKRKAVAFFVASAALMLLGSTPILAQRATPPTSGTVWAVVDLSANFLREDPSFSAELGTQALMGTVMRVDARKDDWYHVHTPEPYAAWAAAMGMTFMTTGEVKDYIAKPKYMVVAEYSHVFRMPDHKGERVCDLVEGDLLLKVLDKKGRPMAKGGYLLVSLPGGRTGYVRRKDVEDFTSWTASRRPDAQHLISTATTFVGVPYQWGGTSIKGVDCSGLTRTVFFLNGILLPRNASQQAKVGDPVRADGVLRGDFSELRDGDLLFFGNRITGRVTHVAMYIGGGRIIHSSQLVRINSLREGDPDYYEGAGRLLQVRRIIGTEDKDKGVKSIRKSPFYFPDNGLLEGPSSSNPSPFYTAAF